MARAVTDGSDRRARRMGVSEIAMDLMPIIQKIDGDEMR